MPNVWDSPTGDIDAQPASIRPIWTLENLDDATAMLESAEKLYQSELRRWRSYREVALKHLALFKGRFSQKIGQSAESSGQGLMGGWRPNKVAQVTVNHLQDLVTQRVSRATRNKPSVVIAPANSEYKDKQSAKLLRSWIDYELYANDFDECVVHALTAAYIMGESYIATVWDPTKGEVDPAWKDAEAEAERHGTEPRVTVTGDDGQPVLGEDGKPLYIDEPTYVGDIAFTSRTVLNTLVELGGSFADARYCIFEDLADVDELKALYPKVADKIQKEDPGHFWSGLSDAPPGALGNKVLVRTLYWAGDQFLRQGRFVKWVNGAILENKPLPEKFTELPLVRFTDIDIPNEQRGQSFFIHGKVLNAVINDLTSMSRRNAMLLAHPKWVVPRGSVIKKEALGNDITIIEYNGSQPPKIEVPPPMSQEVLGLRKELKQDLQTVLGVYDVSRGQVPPNIRSALALQVLDEQEEQRANSGVQKHAKLIRDSIKKAIGLASAYYERDDKRLIPIVGREQAYMLKEFDPAALTKNYDVRVSSNTGLPSGKAARTQTLVELKQAFPTLVRDEMVLDMLQLGDTDKYYDATTAAVKAAEAENESFLNDEDVEDPVAYENLVVHWSVHARTMQSRGFKIDLPEESRQRAQLHQMATEYLLMKAARKNPSMALELVRLPGFPMFYEPSEPDMVLLDRARTGNPLSLLEISMLYETGQLPPGAGAPPPAGGVPNPSAPSNGPLPPEAAAQANDEGQPQGQTQVATGSEEPQPAPEQGAQQ